jgi:hypothetical protein
MKNIGLAKLRFINLYLEILLLVDKKPGIRELFTFGFVS